MTSRRGFLRGLANGALVLAAAPAIVRASSLMAIRPVPPLAVPVLVGDLADRPAWVTITGIGLDGQRLEERVELLGRPGHTLARWRVIDGFGIDA